MSQTRVIFSIMLGKDPTFYYTKKMLQHYAKKTHSDLIILDHVKLAPPAPLCNNQRLSAWYQKKYIRDLQKRYDRVLYMDADIIITPWAKNIFEEYPDHHLDKVFMLDELKEIYGKSLLTHTMQGTKKKHHCHDGSKQVKELISRLGININNSKKIKCYFNAGVILIGKNCKLLKNWCDQQLMGNGYITGSYEQDYINILASKYQISIQDISQHFNRMGYLGAPNSWHETSFFHFAGGAFFTTRKTKRPLHFRKLYLHLHKTKETLPRRTVFYGQHLYFRLKRKLKSIR